MVWSMEIEQVDRRGAEARQTLSHLLLDARLGKTSIIKLIHFGCHYTLHTGRGGEGGRGRGREGEKRQREWQSIRWTDELSEGFFMYMYTYMGIMYIYIETIQPHHSEQGNTTYLNIFFYMKNVKKDVQVEFQTQDILLMRQLSWLHACKKGSKNTRR